MSFATAGSSPIISGSRALHMGRRSRHAHPALHRYDRLRASGADLSQRAKGLATDGTDQLWAADIAYIRLRASFVGALTGSRPSVAPHRRRRRPAPGKLRDPRRKGRIAFTGLSPIQLHHAEWPSALQEATHRTEQARTREAKSEVDCQLSWA